MPTTSACPTRDELESLLLGLMSEEEAGRLEGHVGSCARCLGALQTLRPRDTLLDAVRPDGPSTILREPVDESLVAELCRMQAGKSDTPAGTGATRDLYPFLGPPEQPDEIGRLGPYRVLRLLGAGGMGAVFLAEDVALKRQVALKAMRAEMAAVPNAGQRFLREAQAMAAVKHDHVVTIYQVGEANSVPFLAMELLDGETLESRLRREGGLPVPEVVRIGREIAEGLAAAHDRGLVHRDIKPGNLWLEDRGPAGRRVKVLDFGLARPAGENLHLTGSGAIVGTPAYMAPEQARGDEVDSRSDLFSLGCVLYQIATGRLPFQGKDPLSILHALANATPRPPHQLNPKVPAALSNLILQLLAKEPSKRPPSARAVSERLTAIEAEQKQPVCHRPARRWGLYAAGVLLAVFGLAGWLYGPTVVRVVTNKGELVVEVEDPDLEVLVKPEGVQLQSGKEQALVVSAGAGVVEVRDPAKGWTLVTKEFTLSRGGRQVVRVRAREVAEARELRLKSSVDPAAPPDRDRPFALVGKGEEKREFKTFSEALRERTLSEVIEVHGNGPFPVPPATLDGRGLVLRAAPGYRPVFVARADDNLLRHWLFIPGKVLIEGCDFHSDLTLPDCFLSSGGNVPPDTTWTFRGCRFWVNGARCLIEFNAPRLSLENCLIVGRCRDAILALDTRCDLELSNNLIGTVGLVIWAGHGNQTLRLTRNTFLGGGSNALLAPPLAEAPAQPVTVVAEGNLVLEYSLLDAPDGRLPSEKVAHAQVKWQGRDNLYVRSRIAYVAFAQEKRQVTSLKDWNQLWGQSEPGSVEVRRAELLLTDADLRSVRQKSDVLLRGLGPTGRNVGPDWDLVGPGDAYVKALEQASGQPLPKEALRPAPVAGGPFVRLRKQEAPLGYLSLQEAVSVWQDGDVIEVRTDELFPGAFIRDTEHGGRLVIRAAPGYRPVLRGSLSLELPKVETEIAGLTFDESVLGGACGRLTMRNCALWSTKESWTVAPQLHGPGEAARFLHCAFNGTVDAKAGPGQTILVENCVTTRLSIGAEAKGAGELVIRRSACWTMGSGSGIVGSDHGPEFRPRVVAEDSLFVGDRLLIWMGEKAHWSGKHNVYCLTTGYALRESVPNLEAWRKRNDSDHDSLSVPPLVLDPQQWRVLPGQPKQADGRDYGADVDRIARAMLADLEKPFVLVQKGGEKRGFKSLHDALRERKAGETIEVHGNGPFSVPADEVDGRGLTLKAAPGYRPVLVPQIEEVARGPWLAIRGGDVVVEGCDFHSNTIFPGWFLDSGPESKPAAPWAFRNCRFWVNGARGLIASQAPRLFLEDCLICGNFGEAFLSLGTGVDLGMTNNLVYLAGPQGIVAAGNQTLRLTSNTFDAGPVPLVRPPLEEAPARPVAVVAEGNVFRDCPLFGSGGGGMPSEAVTRAQVKWQGKDNLYAGGKPYVSFAREKREVKSLDEWNRFWGRPEPGAVETTWLGLQSNAVAHIHSRTAVQIARLEVETLTQRPGAGARNVGPEWDVVGPGDAYLRALEKASGKPLPKERLRPGAPAGGAFVLLRGEESPRGLATLQAALDASQDGDVIEVRTDGDIAGAKLKAPERGGRLVIRAAPGYQPAPQTRIHLELPKADVEIEGLAFEHAGHLSGEYGRLTLRNCALGGFQEGVDVKCSLHGPGQAGRFINSVFTSGPACSVGPGQGILLESCIVVRASISARAAEDDCEMVLRRCVCWGQGPGYVSVACDGNSGARSRVHAEDSVFVGGALFGWAASQARWSGKHNVYSLTGLFGMRSGPIYTLEAWQKRWDSDRDSLFTPSPFLEPRTWRLGSGVPKRPDGRTYGADVDRVTTAKAIR